jgi:serine phosphatase RsbU (regulator of sigma subunit)
VTADSKDQQPPQDVVAFHDQGLGAVVQAASEAVAAAEATRADAVAAVADAQLSADPGTVALEAANTAGQAAVEAAARTADAARSARAARAAAAQVAAATVAESAARTVQAVQDHADELAVSLAGTAAAAAAAVAAATPDVDVEAAREAVRVGAAVVAAAALKAEETAQVAVQVARTVAAAAAAVAATTAAEAAAMEHEVLDAAVAVRAVTAETAHQLATETVDRAAAVATATRAAAVASERLREANRQLQRAGRHDRSVALALQAAMLTQLPEPANLQLAARYLTAAEQDQVGGDWYDALVLADGSTTLVIGDVVGHDIVAAAVMGQLRNVLRAFVWDRDEAPSAVVARLDRAIRDLHINTQATMIVVNVKARTDHPSGGRNLLTWTNAGHPAPILVHADGTAILLPAMSDVLLGVVPDRVRNDQNYLVPAGATLLLYTDGLIEHRSRGIDVGQQLLLDAVHAHHRLQPGDLLDAVISDMVGNRPADDVAVLAARFLD